ncbi:chromosome transmission fidelity protein 18 homolog isoform X2 [Catharus ustulatus]|uniref:chromosome transmission fidelity protein 18 homolog isoform X2 n=1 Tax=Catharus ustulatus TaxID=91951 RepID=UPI0014081BC3|nr:chromosome transmission fidelity protein 18 homolog isoform X2 [Catharus ustulatus]
MAGTEDGPEDGLGDGPEDGLDDGPEDNFYERFADELEVLAELEDEPFPPAGPKPSQFRSKRQRPEEPDPPGDSPGGTGDRDGVPAMSPVAAEPRTPRPKRQRLEAAKKLNFGVDDDDVSWDGGPEAPLAPHDSSSRMEMSGMIPLQPTPPSEKRRVLRRPPVLEDYINVTSSQGCRVFLVLRDDPCGTGLQLPDSLRWNARRPLHLLGVPFSYLKEQVDEERRRQVLEASQQLTEIINNCLGSEPSAESPDPSPDTEPAAEEESASHCLWVDKFTPRRYMELLSDDYTNHCLLKWLKLWDTVVFGKDKAGKKPKPSPAAHPHLSHAKEQPNKWKTKVQLTEEMLEAELDQHKRPKYKVALLCGPPGLGKTTLAHVIARHAGYNAVEMNASDDRSPEVFRTRIEAATQMRSVLGSHERPNCLIIDEIDGAPAASINVLLSIIQRKDREGEAGAGRRRREGGLLLRPIICICNDQFVPALRPLRQQSFLLSFPRTAPSRLAQRLSEIALQQGMRADTGALLALCEKTDSDIRSCINTLQFLHGRGQKELSVQLVQTMRIGLKDQNKGLFSIWQEIFQLPKPQRHRIGMDPSLPAQLLLGDEELSHPGGSGGFSSSSQRFHHILQLSISSGEQDKLAQGLFENFLKMKVRDSSLGSVCLALEWLSFSDLLGRAVLQGQSFQLLRYLPFLPVAFHLLFAASSIPRLAYPSSQPEAVAKLSQMQNVLLSVVSGMAPGARGRAGLQELVLDVLSLLLDIIAPRLRPVNTQLYSLKEKQQLAELISTMLTYNLTYLQERLPEGQYVFKLDPNVEAVCRFPALPARRQLSYQAKQLIAREIELEKMRRAEARNLAQDPGNGLGEEPAETPSHQQRLEHLVRRAAVQDKPEVDFFGRPLQRKEAATAPAPQEGREESLEVQMGKAVGRSDVWFRFNEGFSNAVRRNLYIRDLL